MLVTALCYYALANSQEPANRREAPAGHTYFAIYKKNFEDLNGFGSTSTADRGGKTVRYDRLGMCSWKMMDGGIRGVPCKLYEAVGSWTYSIRKNGLQEYHEVNFRSTYQVKLDGVPMHSETHFTDQAQKSRRKIDVIADYGIDSINVKIVRNGVAERVTHYPAFGMERFAGMFEPLMRTGLIQTPEMKCAVLHPFTGAPYEFTLKVRSRFTGTYFFLPQAGYCIEVDGKEGTGLAYLTRQGQLLKMGFPGGIEAFLESGPLAPERKGWGTFNVLDWDKSTDETNPERPIYHTTAIPVMFKDPTILFPVPCALTD